MVIEWSKRILKKWFWTIGLLPVAIDLISAYIPQQDIPPFLAEFLTNGSNWIFTFTLVTIFLLVSSYLVFLEEVQARVIENSDLREKLSVLQTSLDSYQNSEPRLVFGFKGVNRTLHTLHKEISVKVKTHEEKPDFDLYLDARRSMLLSKYSQQTWKDNSQLFSQHRFLKQKDVYEEEVEEHIEKYRDYLERKYAAQVTNSVALWVYPVAKNEGRSPAEKTTIIISLPPDYEHPTESVFEIAKVIHDGEENYLKYFLRPPAEPSLTLNLDMMNFSLPDNKETPDFSELIRQASNVNGPSYLVRSDGVATVEYEVKELVQHKSEVEMDPFLLWLESAKNLSKWELPVKIVSASLREPIFEKLTIQVELSE